MTRRMCLMAAVAAAVMASTAVVQAAVVYETGQQAVAKPKIAVDFGRWDHNGDGVIDHAEFTQGMKKLGRLMDKRRGQRGPQAREGRQGRRGPRAQRGPRGQRGPDARRGPRGSRGPGARRGRGPGPEMLKRIQAMVRRTVKQTLRQMHNAGGPPHGGQSAFGDCGHSGAMHGPKGGRMHGQMRGPKGKGMHGPKHGAMWQGMRGGPRHGGPPNHGGFGRGPGAGDCDGPPMGRMHGGPPMGGCPACGCQCGGMGGPKGEFRGGPMHGQGGEGRGEFRGPGKKGRRGPGPAARRRGPRGDGPMAGRRGPKGDGPPPRLMEMFKRQDVNGDGVVTADEFMGPPDRFEMLDANGDGAVDRKEIKKMMKRKAKQGRAGKKGRPGKKARGHEPGPDHRDGHGFHGDAHE